MTALIGALRVSLSADTAAFQTGMKRAERQAKTSSTAINKSLGLIKSGFAGFVSGISLGIITQGIKSSLDYAGSLKEVAQQLGVTARELQVFRYAVQQNGGTLESADKALGKLAISISAARSGSKQAAEAFAAAGVSLNDLSTKSKTEIIGQIADQFKAAGGAAANAKAGVALFGRDFLKLVPTLDQGSKGLNALTKAAEELGIILDDQLIDQADEAADKVDALQTVLKAQIAGAVAKNSSAIIELANSLVFLVSKIADAIQKWNDFKAALDAQAFDLASKNPFLSDAKRREGAERAARARGRISDSGVGWNVAGSKVIKDLNNGGTALEIAKKMGLKVAGEGGGGGSPAQFLGGGGGGSRRGGAGDAERKRLEALRDQFQFEDDIRRLQMDVLRAQESLATDYSERARLQIEMLNLEQVSLEEELKYQVAAKEITQAQADQIKAEHAKRDSLERQLVLREEEERRQKDYAMLEDRDFDARREMLERQAELANNYQERRDVEMRILDLAYEEERNRLNRIIRESQDWAEIEAARRDLLDLTRKQATDREITRRNTAGPFESAQTEFSDITDEMENLKVNGIMAAADALTALTGGFDDFKDAAVSAIKQVVAEFIRLQTLKFLFSLFPSPTGTTGFGPTNPGVGFATGGFTGWGPRDRIAGFVHGQEGVLNTTGLRTLGIPNLNALNSGSPLAAVSNDNGVSQMSGGDMHVHIGTLGGGMSPFEGRQTGRQLGRGFKERVAFGATGRRTTR